MKKNIYVSLVIMLISGSINHIKCQNQQQNLDNYWHYRYRLINYFTNVGMGDAPFSTDPQNAILGQSVPAAQRNAGDGAVGPDLYWGDVGRIMGYYIGTLATEYRLLKDNGQPTDETVMELFYAMHALFRLDSVGIVQYWASGAKYSPWGYVPRNPTFPGIGYMCSDDVTTDFISQVGSGNFQFINGQNPAYPSSGTFIYTTKDPLTGNTENIALHGSGEVGWINTIESGMASYQGDVTNSNRFMDNHSSQDNMIAALMGLSIAVQCIEGDYITGWNLPGNTYSFSPYYPDLRTMAQQLGQAILNNFQIQQFDVIGYPDGTPYGGESVLAFAVGLIEAGNSYLFNGSYAITAPITWTAAQAAWVTEDICSIYDLAYPLNQKNIEWANVEMYAEASVMSDNGAKYLTTNKLIKGIDDAANAYPYGCYNLDVVKAHWDEFYWAIHELLWPSPSNFKYVNLCDMNFLVNTAPKDGPFCHIDEEDYWIDWACDKRFCDLPYQVEKGQYADPGNYSGLDYMLFYNLYRLMVEHANNYNSTVVNNNSYSTNGLSKRIMGIPDVYPFNYSYDYGLEWTYTGTQSDPATISADACAPIYIQQLNVNSGVSLKSGYDGKTVLNDQNGSLYVYGGEGSFIDLKPVAGNIIIQYGANFDAVCDLTCCGNDEVPYVSELNDQAQQYARPYIPGTDNTTDAPYQKSLEFDTLYGNNGIMTSPNPFASQATIDFYLRTASPVNIYITDVNGKRVADIVTNEEYSKGNHLLNFNGSGIANGTYICVMETTAGRKTFKMVKAG
ncbi:MAG: T9SS type A sorting domain-containing protein [Bacteroidia bacterium]